MKTNKEFSDYVFEKAEKYKKKKAAMYRRISSGIACCLVLVFTAALMSTSGIFDMEQMLPEVSGNDKIRMYSVESTADTRQNKAMPTSVTTTVSQIGSLSPEVKEEIYNGGLYFYIKTYNELENEYTILHSADAFTKYSYFISNMESSGAESLSLIQEAAANADFTKCDMIVLRISETSSGNMRKLSYSGVKDSAYNFSMSMNVESSDCSMATDYYVIFVPKQNADTVKVDFNG
ncbi:MAG: hypothetical protein ACI3XF_01480 [Eubacteriales bacterium]